MTEMTIDALVLTDWEGHGLRDGDLWRYTFTARVQPHTLRDGELQPIEGPDLRLLTEQCGFVTGLRSDVSYPAGEHGGSPASAQVGPAMLAWAQGEIAAATEQWVGRVVRLTMEAAGGA